MNDAEKVEITCKIIDIISDIETIVDNHQIEISGVTLQRTLNAVTVVKNFLLESIDD